ncbi:MULTISPECIES: stage III sporulation protein AC [Jeotgalibacillus]|uniref:Stage III sporulation protein AC n=1 Tax=Jeotgalibacillus campisalis TaxID=220754 RepID=A0A0C2RW20_9BACL|nr:MULTISPECIES: stage III sporulation protein AC [Jeotgalibacillus]KIL45954.1 stage III sporulation protein AC [Jeotgalibacillus campisalis]MDG5470770.1 stage III sporulation protein AC [Jeotgalibacillus sp. ET6]
MAIDIDTLFKIAGVGLVVALLYTVLDQVGKKDFAQWLAFAGFLYVLFIVLQALDSFFTTIRSVFMFYE